MEEDLVLIKAAFVDRFPDRREPAFLAHCH
jgi:hypothetical protein